MHMHMWPQTHVLIDIGTTVCPIPYMGRSAHIRRAIHPNNGTPTMSSQSSPATPRTITIQDITFPVPQPYATGHTVNEVEASVLNQQVAEALRNNFSKRVKDFKTKSPQADQTAVDALKAEFASYAADYSFKAKGAPKQPLDPIQKEAEKIATGQLTTALNKNNMKRAELAEGRWDLLLAEVAAKPAVQAEAKRRVEAAKSFATDALTGLLDTVAQAPEAVDIPIAETPVA